MRLLVAKATLLLTGMVCAVSVDKITEPHPLLDPVDENFLFRQPSPVLPL